MQASDSPDSYTMFPNGLMSQMLRHHCSRVCMALIMCISRYSFGYHKKECALALSTMAAYSFIAKPHVSQALNQMIRAHIIKVKGIDEGTHARILSVNMNYDEWDIEVTETATMETEPEVTEEVTGPLPEEEPSALPEKEPEKKSEIKDKQSKMVVVEVNKINNNDNTSAAAADLKAFFILEENIKYGDPKLTDTLVDIYRYCFHYKPNSCELVEIKKTILDDTRFTPAVNLKIFGRCIGKNGCYPDNKKNTQYLLGMIRLTKMEFLQKIAKKKEEDEKEKRRSAERSEEPEWKPGEMMKYYFEDMKKG